MFITIVLALVASAFVGYHLRTNFRQRTVELIAAGVGASMLLFIAFGSAIVPAQLLPVLPFLPLLTTASIILGRIIHDRKQVEERLSRFEAAGTSVVLSLSALFLLALGMFFLTHVGASTTPTLVAFIGGLYMFGGAMGLRSAVCLAVARS
jgi:hypothetical protein